MKRDPADQREAALEKLRRARYAAYDELQNYPAVPLDLPHPRSADGRILAAFEQMQRGFLEFVGRPAPPPPGLQLTAEPGPSRKVRRPHMGPSQFHPRGR